MQFARQIGHWFTVNAQTIYYLMATAGAFVAVLTYYRNSVIERARWLSSLYSKFYEAPDLKRIRKCLDENAPNAPQVQDLVRDEDSDFTDYLNFFEFMAYLENRGQLSKTGRGGTVRLLPASSLQAQRRARICTGRQERIRISEETSAAFPSC